MDQLPQGLRQARPYGARELSASLKSQIDHGAFQPGAPLPSTRALAAEFGCSRTTVIAAYEQLLAEGYIETHPGRRARVAAALRPARARDSSAAQPQPPARLSAVGRRLAALSGPPVVSAAASIDFRYGDIAAADFPRQAWRRALNKAMGSGRGPGLRYTEPEGAIELRTALQTYLWRARGLRCEAGQIVVVSGSQQGLDLCARILLDPGDSFVIEDPCYWAARHVFESVGATPLFLPVDHEGLQTERLTDEKTARLCYVTPSHQYPLGHVLSAARRDQLLHWAGRTGAYVVEDDYDGEFRYDIRPVQPLHARGGEASVLYLGTISKTLSPLLRIGYLVLPTTLVDVFRTAKRLTDRHSPTHEQVALADFIQSGGYDRHVRRLRRRNAERRAALLDALASHFGESVEVQGSEAGLHVVVWFNDVPAAGEADLARRARALGIAIYPISGLYDGRAGTTRHRAGFVFGYAALEERDIAKGIARLAGAMRA